MTAIRDFFGGLGRKQIDMDMMISGISAFRYYRTPPQVLALLPGLPRPADPRALPGHPLVEHLFGLPLHTLVTDANHRSCSNNVASTVWSGTLPSGAEAESPWCETIASPLFTLFTLARTLPVVDLALAMYEFCGEFSVYGPAPELEGRIPDILDGWKRVKGPGGQGTDLWMRPPLIERDDLLEFAQRCRGKHGCRAFAEAASLVFGITRSPMEAQAALLLGAPRTKGGYGFALETNRPVRLTATARKIGLRDYCVADLYLESPDGTKAVDVECQGNIVHNGVKAAESDADRTTALESMGTNVVLLSHGQLASETRLAHVADHIARLLGVKLKPKTERMRKTERDLRRRIFIDWRTLGGSIQKSRVLRG